MDELDKLVQAILKSPNYRDVCEDLIRNIGSRELAARRNWKEAVKATKNKLHQVGGAYFDGRIEYARWLDELRAATDSGDRERFLRVCIDAMKYHSSTRERLGILDQFYALTLDDLPAIGTVLDIACGLNPLAIPWMPLGKDVQYYAFDMYRDMVAFLNGFMSIANVRGQAEVRDVTRFPPARRADLAFILKSLPCIEQLDKSAGVRLLEAINADHLLISFPVRSLGGRDKRMAQNYEERFRELMVGRRWSVRRFEFATELAFLVGK
jgi:16S rRNA (guanine(1405)-N(7))-methyltransferase